MFRAPASSSRPHQRPTNSSWRGSGAAVSVQPLRYATLRPDCPSTPPPKKNLTPIAPLPQDIGGYDIQKQEIREAVELPLTQGDLYRQLGIDPPRGVLLYGPPGTGKTMLAKAVAHHTTAAFIRVVGSEFVQKYLGEVRGGGAWARGRGGGAVGGAASLCRSVWEEWGWGGALVWQEGGLRGMQGALMPAGVLGLKGRRVGRQVQGAGQAEACYQVIFRGPGTWMCLCYLCICAWGAYAANRMLGRVGAHEALLAGDYQQAGRLVIVSALLGHCLHSCLAC